MTSKGKRLTYLTISLGVLVLLVAGYAFKDRAVEQWYLWKLESEASPDVLSKKQTLEHSIRKPSVHSVGRRR